MFKSTQTKGILLRRYLFPNASLSVVQRVSDLIPCPSTGLPVSSPLRQTQMARGSSDQSEALSVCQTDSSSVPEAHYQAAAAVAAAVAVAATTVMQPPDGCMQLTTRNTSLSVTTSCL